jgi:hypothetical protein
MPPIDQCTGSGERAKGAAQAGRSEARPPRSQLSPPGLDAQIKIA